MQSLYLDEAHSFGIYGKNGFGISSDKFEIRERLVGTFGKKVGSYGAFVSCSRKFFEMIVNPGNCPFNLFHCFTSFCSWFDYGCFKTFFKTKCTRASLIKKQFS